MKNSYLSLRSEELKKKNLDEIPLAYVWDRVAAFVVDLLIISVVANIFLAPFRKKMQAAILDEHNGVVNLMVLSLVVGYALFFIFYHSLSIYFFKATIGKKIFKIDVVPLVHGQPFTLINCFIRSALLFVSMALACIPLLEVFSNRLRRPLHDRLSDTYVRSLKKQDTAPTQLERVWVRFVYAIVAINISIVVSAQVAFFYTDVKKLSEFVTQPEYLCNKVSDAKTIWPNAEQVSRLDIALTLYGADKIDETCLEKEAIRAINYGEELDKAYLAKAFIYENNNELSDKYLKKVCSISPQGEPCFLTEMITQWSEQNWKGADIMIEQRRVASDHLKVWIIKHYDKTQNYSQVLKLTDELWNNRSLNDFVGRFRALTLWKVDRTEESRGAFNSTYAYLPDSSKMAFASEFCNLEIESQCATSAQSGCKILVDELKDGPRQFVPEETLLTYIKTSQCGMADIDYIVDNFRFNIDDPKIQMYLAGIKAKASGKDFAADQIFKNILKTTTRSSFLSYEARTQLIFSADDKSLREHSAWWLESENTGMYHQLLGNKIVAALSSKSLWKDAMPIARKLLEGPHLSKQQAQALAVVFYNTKEYTLAKKVIDIFDMKSSASGPSRGLASQDQFNHIKKKVERIFKENQK